MSSVKYQKAYDRMTEKQKQIMANLYMKGINHDGHSWNTYGDIEDAVADLLELTKKLYENEKELSDLKVKVDEFDDIGDIFQLLLSDM